MAGFSLTDQWGTQIVLTEEDWTRICGKHPEVAPYEEQVRRAILEPCAVYEGSPGQLVTKVFYGEGLIADARFRGCFVAVVVRYSDGGDAAATIRTVYLPVQMRGKLGKVLYRQEGGSA